MGHATSSLSNFGEFSFLESKDFSDLLSYTKMKRPVRMETFLRRLGVSKLSCRFIRFHEINTNMKYRILIEQDEEGAFVAECSALPGCISQGGTRKEALKNIQDAIQGYLESLKKHNEPVPPSIHEEWIDIS